MTIKRKTETPAMARRICFAQGVIPCCLCGIRLKPDDKVIREHKHALCLGGADEEENMGYAHEACAKFKTTGRKHMADGDSQKITKMKRLAKGGKTKSKHKIKSNGSFPKGRKIPSRPFPQRKKEQHGTPT